MQVLAARRILLGLAFVCAWSAASVVVAQQPQRYLPPLPSPPPAGAPGSPYPPPAGAPASPGTAAGQLRLLDNSASPAVAASADGPAGQGSGQAGDNGPPDLRMAPSRGPAAQSGNDPTMPGPAIRELIDNGSGGGARAPQAGPPPLPEMRLRARIFARDKPPMAVVEVGGKPLSVRVGSEIQFSGPGGGPMQLKVIELTTSELQIEIVGRKQIITLN